MRSKISFTNPLELSQVQHTQQTSPFPQIKLHRFWSPYEGPTLPSQAPATQKKLAPPPDSLPATCPRRDPLPSGAPGPAPTPSRSSSPRWRTAGTAGPSRPDVSPAPYPSAQSSRPGAGPPARLRRPGAPGRRRCGRNVAADGGEHERGQAVRGHRTRGGAAGQQGPDSETRRRGRW